MRHRASGLALLASAVVCLSACGDRPDDGTRAYGPGKKWPPADGLVCSNLSGAQFAGRAVECDIKDTMVRIEFSASAGERDERVADLRSTLQELSVPYCPVVGSGAEATWAVSVEVTGDDFCGQVTAVFGVQDPIRGAGTSSAARLRARAGRPACATAR